MNGNLIHEIIDSHQYDENLNHVVSTWLQCIIRDLDNKYKEAILLTELEGISQRQLAEKLGMSVSGVKSRVQRGREKIKELLLNCCEIELDRRGNVIDYQIKSARCTCSAC